MNGQFQVAQGSGTGNSGNSTPPRIFKLTKPLTDQAVVLNLGYDQKVQVDFSSIANEKITLVHVGEKLIILFDNQSTVTVEPFFDSRHDALNNLTIEVAPGRDLSVAEFASSFPISTDQSVLPAAGTGGGNAQGAGAHFDPSAVDALPPVPTNSLAPPEVLPNLTFVNPASPLLTTPTPVGPTIAAGVGPVFVVDESFIPGIGSQTGPAGSYTSTESLAASFTVTAPAGVRSVTYALTINSATTNLIDSVSGQTVTLVSKGGGEVDGVVTIAGKQTEVFTLTVDSAGHVTMTELRGVHEGSADTGGDISEGISLSAGLVSVTATVTDNNNATASASIDLGPEITIHDDGPTMSATGAGPALTLSETHLTVTALDDYIAGSAPNAALTSTTGDFSKAFTSVQGADGATIAYALSITGGNGTLSGLIDSHTGQADVLVLNGNTIEGHVGAIGGTLAFTITVDPATGIVTFTEDRAVSQAIASSPDTGEGISLTAGLVNLTATITDNDGDTAKASLDLGKQLTITDDGPTAPAVTLGAATVGVDETPGVQTTGGASDVAGSTTVTFNGVAGTTVASLFATVASKGTDTDVPSGSLDNGALSFASSGASSIVSVGTLTYGADGPAASGAEKFALSLISSASGLTLTDGTAVTLSLDSAGRVIGTVGTDTVHSNLSGETAFALAIDQVTGEVYVAQYLSLHQDGLATTPNDLVTLATGSVGVTVTLTDGDGDQATSAVTDISSHVSFLDDGPTAPAVTLGAATVGVDETPGVQTTGGASDVAGSTTVTFNGVAGTTVASLFATVASKGTDTDVPSGSLDNGALSFASSGASSIVTIGTLTYGADGPAASGAEKFALSLISSASGLTLTDGTAVTLSLDSAGRVIGTVGTDTVHSNLSGETAFALAIDQVTGEVYVAQYLSLHQDGLATTPNDLVTLATGSVGVTVTLTDGDGDQATSAVTDISSHVSFLDDGPTAPAVTLGAATVGVDETPGVQTTGGASDVAGSTTVTFNGVAGTTVASLFATVASKGTDTDVPSGSLDNGALSFASSGASSIVTIGTLTYGADGPAASGAEKFALSLISSASGLTLTDGTAVTLSLDSAGRVIGTVGTDTVHSNLSGETAFALAIDQVTGEVYVAQYLSLHQDGLATTPNDLVTLATGSVGVTVTLTDGDGDQATSAVTDISSHVSFLDDGPTAPAVTLGAATVGVDETPGVQTTGGASDVAGSTTVTFNGVAGTTVASLFATVASKGTDTDVPSGSLDNGALSFASSGASSIVTIGTLTYGADGPAASGAEKIALTVTNTASGLTLTDGTAITLSLDGSGRVIGTVGTDTVHSNLSGETAFALAIDQVTGEVYVAQYLSLHQDGLATTPNDLVTLATGSVGVTVTLTDGDGDQATSAVTDISSHVSFLDDGPTAPAVTLGAATVGVDETPGVQTTGGASDVAGSTTVTFNGVAGTTVASLFATVASKGTDTDVPSGSLDNGALSFASSGASSIVTIGTLTYGADGPAASGAEKFALSLISSASGLTLTDGTAVTLSLDSAGRVIGTVGTDTVHSNLSGETAFALAIDQVTGEVYVAQYLSLHQDGLATTPNDLVTLATGSVGVTVTLTDGDGDQATSAVTDISSHVSFLDDGPTAPAVTLGAATVGVDETPGVQTTGGASDVAGSTTVTFNGVAGTTVASLFATVASKGTDTDVPSGSLDNGALSFASSGASSIVTIGTLTYGADGPAASGAEKIALTVTNTASGLTLTDGTAITLSLDGSGRVIGTVGTDAANPGLSGKTAFAIAIDPTTGQSYVAEYLSLHQDSASNTPNDAVSLATGSVGVTVTLTDGDGDKATTTTDISSHVSFLDDGPTITAVQDAVMPNVNLTDVQGTWQPTFGADGLASAGAIGITIPSATIGGTTYTVTDTHTHNGAGDEVFQVAVSGSPGYTFYEYTHYTAGTQTAEMFAYTSEASAQAGLANNEFFTLSMAANGTYDFHLVTNSLQTTETLDLTAHSGNGEIFEINGNTGAYSNPHNIPTAGFDLLIDGWDLGDTDPTDHTIHGNANGFGVDDGNLDTNETIAFTAGQDQSSMTIGVGKSGNATNETLQITIWNDAHNHSATETITQLDGTAIKIDAADWTGTGVNAFFNFKEADVTNLGGTSGCDSDDKVDLTSVAFNISTTVASTTLNFTPTITDGDGDTATGTNLSVALNGTANSNGGYTLVGGTESDVILSSSHVDTMTGGGGNDTFEFNSPLDGGGKSSGTITSSNTDTITDFNTANDLIAVSAAGFGGGLTIGEVFNNTQVVTLNNSSAFDNTGNERFVFDQGNHTLYYSPDGHTSNEHALAILNGVTSINATNIHVVA